ncbi:MAG: rhomboid family intramembrane serine protease [Protaetiibacter sp.]
MSSPRFGEQLEDDPSVCYRHPGRQSWVLCQRCGRTICPECQILAPVGVQCPDCVREANGSVQWTPAHTKPAKQRTAARRMSAVTAPRSGFGGWLSGLLRPGGATPPLSWIFAGVLVALWIVGLVTANLPLQWLAAIPEDAWQLWRYVTAPFASFAALSLTGILGIAISLFFWLLIAPSAERSLGRRRFLVVFAASSAVGSAAMLIAGLPIYGFSAPLFGVFGAYAVISWSYPPARMQIIGVLVLNLIINIYVSSGYSLPYLIGGALAGAGVTYLLQFYEGRARSKPSTPYLIIAAGAAVLIAIAIAVNVARF